MRILFITLLLAISVASWGQTQKNFYVAPSFSIGYTFWGGLNYGFDIDFGVWQHLSENGTCVIPGLHFQNHGCM